VSQNTRHLTFDHNVGKWFSKFIHW